MTNWQQLRLEVFERDNYTCQTCLKEKATDVHHIIPRHKNGLNTLNNLISQCERCHKLIELNWLIHPYFISNKSDSFPIDFIIKLGALNKDKFHLIIPKEYCKQVKDLKGKHVRVYVDDEI